MVEAPKQYPDEVHMDELKTKKKRKFSKVFLITTLLSPIIMFIVITITVVLLVFMPVMEGDVTTPELSEYGEGVIPPEFIPIYQEAGEKYGIDWILLAAIHNIETTFSQNVKESTAGAIGHMQFMPCTWVGWKHPSCSGNGKGNIPEIVLTDPAIIEKYGGYGVDANGNLLASPYEIEDSIHAAAKYLSANMKGKTEEEKVRNALYSYNHADWYVNSILDLYNQFTMGYADDVVIGNKAWPVPYTQNITSHFNPNRKHPITGKIQAHKGIDISSSGVLGKPVVAFTDGTVISSGWNVGGYGYLVIIQHDKNIMTYYAHLKEQGIPTGTKVKAGQIVGYVGSTGNSTGPHLHFEIRVNGKPVNPLPYLSEFLK